MDKDSEREILQDYLAGYRLARLRLEKLKKRHRDIRLRFSPQKNMRTCMIANISLS